MADRGSSGRGPGWFSVAGGVAHYFRIRLLSWHSPRLASPFPRKLLSFRQCLRRRVSTPTSLGSASSTTATNHCPSSSRISGSAHCQVFPLFVRQSGPSLTYGNASPSNTFLGSSDPVCRIVFVCHTSNFDLAFRPGGRGTLALLDDYDLLFVCPTRPSEAPFLCDRLSVSSKLGSARLLVVRLIAINQALVQLSALAPALVEPPQHVLLAQALGIRCASLQRLDDGRERASCSSRYAFLAVAQAVGNDRSAAHLYRLATEIEAVAERRRIGEWSTEGRDRQIIPLQHDADINRLDLRWGQRGRQISAPWCVVR